MDESVGVEEIVKKQVSQVIFGTRVPMDTMRAESWLAIYKEIFERHKDDLLAISGNRLVEYLDRECGGRAEIHYGLNIGPNTKLVAWYHGPSVLPPRFPTLSDRPWRIDRAGISIVLLAHRGNLKLGVVQFEFGIVGGRHVVRRYAQQFFPSFEQWQDLLCHRSHGIGFLHGIKKAIEEDLSETHKRIKKLNRLEYEIKNYSSRITMV